MFRIFIIILSVTVGFAKPQWHISSVLENTRTPIKSVIVNLDSMEQKVTLQLFYESLCPDCEVFDPEFIKVVKKLFQYVDVHTYPFGNADLITNPDGRVMVVCQHGKKECYGNMLHACAIDVIGDVMTSIQYNACMMKFSSNDTAADKCGKQMKIPLKMVEATKKCAKGPRGYKLLLQYGRESKKVNFQYVPYVLINGVEYNTTEDFMKAVCSAFASPPPPCLQVDFY